MSATVTVQQIMLTQKFCYDYSTYVGVASAKETIRGTSLTARIEYAAHKLQKCYSSTWKYRELIWSRGKSAQQVDYETTSLTLTKRNGGKHGNKPRRLRALPVVASLNWSEPGTEAWQWLQRVTSISPWHWSYGTGCVYVTRQTQQTGQSVVVFLTL